MDQQVVERNSNRACCKKLGLVNIGSGSAYRCVALETINKGIDLKEKEK